MTRRFVVTLCYFRGSFFVYMLKMYVRRTECFIFLVSLHITQSWGFVMIN